MTKTLLLAFAAAGLVGASLVAPADSALNQVSGRVETIVPVGNRVRVRIGALTAELTASSAERLALQPGSPVVATFKATAKPVLIGTAVVVEVPVLVDVAEIFRGKPRALTPDLDLADRSRHAPVSVGIVDLDAAAGDGLAE